MFFPSPLPQWIKDLLPHWPVPLRPAITTWSDGTRVLTAVLSNDPEEHNWIAIETWEEAPRPVIDAANVFHVPVRGKRLGPVGAWLVWKKDPAAPHLHHTTAKNVTKQLEENALNFVRRWGFLGLHRVEPWASRWAERWPESVLPRDGTCEPLDLFLDAIFPVAVACEMAYRFASSQDEERWKLAHTLAHGWDASVIDPALARYRIRIPGLAVSPPWADAIYPVYVPEPWVPPGGGIIHPPGIKLPLGQATFYRRFRFATLWHALWALLGELLSRGLDYLRRCKRPTCGRLFYAKRSDQEYCSDDCRNAAQLARSRARRRRTEEKGKEEESS